MAGNDHLARAPGTKAAECISSSLALFDEPYTDMSVERAYFVPVRPSTAISESANSILFSVAPSEDLTDYSQSVFQITVKITDNLGQDIPAFVAPDATKDPNPANSVGFCNLPPTSLFSNVIIRASEENLSDSFGTMPYLSYLQCILNYSKEARDSLLQLQGFYFEKDLTANNAHTAAPDDGFKTRSSLTSESKEATFISPFYNALFSQNRWGLPMLGWTAEFLKAPASFTLISNSPSANYKIKITDMKLWIRRIKLRSSYKLELEEKLLKEPSIYPLRVAYCKPFFIDANTKSWSAEDIFGSKSRPSMCMIGFVKQRAYRGTYSLNPYNFEHCSVTSIKISIDSESYSYEPNFTGAKNADHSLAYWGLHKNDLKIDAGNMISYDQFKSGYALYYFDLGSENSTANDHVDLKKIGSAARIDVTFASTSTNESLVAILYAENNEKLMVDKSRRVIKDFYI